QGPLLCPGKKRQHVHFCNHCRHVPTPLLRLFYLRLHEVLVCAAVILFKIYIDFLRRGNFNRGWQTGSCLSNLSPLLCTSLQLAVFFFFYYILVVFTYSVLSKT